MIQRYGYLSEDYNKFNCIGTIFMYWNGWGSSKSDNSSGSNSSELKTNSEIK